MRILIVEDDPDASYLDQRYIHKFRPDAEVVVQTRGDAEAEKAIRFGGPWDLILLDWRLPGTYSGVELMRFARESAPDATVVITTSLPNGARGGMTSEESAHIEVYGKDGLLKCRLERLLRDRHEHGSSPALMIGA